MSRRTFPDFSLLEPKNIKEASSMLSQYGEDARILAGGTDLFVLMRNKVASPRYLITLSKIPSLDYIDFDEDNGLRIGAMSTIQSIKSSATVRKEYLCLYEAACAHSSVQIRNMGTVSGNLCNASPAADLAPPLLVLGAKLKIFGPAGESIVSLENFFTGPGKTVLGNGEVLTEIQVPQTSQNVRTAFIKMGRTAADLAKINVAVDLTVDGSVCKNVKIAFGSVAPTPMRAKETEKILEGKIINDQFYNDASEAAAKEVKPITDVRSTSEYRMKVTRIIINDALRKAIDRK